MYIYTACALRIHKAVEKRRNKRKSRMLFMMEHRLPMGQSTQPSAIQASQIQKQHTEPASSALRPC